MSTLLVIDDEPLTLECFRLLFPKGQVRVLTAGSAAEGVELFRSDRPDVAVLDVRLPDASGLDAFRQLKEIDPKVPVVLATGSFTALAWPWGAVEWSIVGMAAINVFSYWIFIYLVTATGPIFATQMAYVVMVSGVLWGMLIFGESHSAWIWGALAVMLTGLALVGQRSEGRSGPDA